MRWRNLTIAETQSWLKHNQPSKSIKRTADLIEKEYDQDKYGSLIGGTYKNASQILLKFLKQRKLPPKKIVCIGNKLYEVNTKKAIYYNYQQIIMKILQYLKYNTTVCDLGCGFGYILDKIKSCTNVVGGELSENARILASQIGLSLHHFDFYDPHSYEFIPNPAIIITTQAIEQLPSAQPFIDNLKKHTKKIRCVLQFEPSITTRPGKLGELQNTYAESNDYNTDLDYILLTDPTIAIIERSINVFGFNPLNPLHCYVWKFKRAGEGV